MTFLKPTHPPSLNPSTPSAIPEIHYPDSDGQPMADNTLQFHWIVTLKEGLDWLFAQDPNVFVAGDLLWYPVEGDPKIRQAPDALVVFGRPKGYRGSYQQWKEEGIPPQVVFEVLSPGNRRAEMSRKLGFYDQYGVEEYYLYDPDTNTLAGWIREPDGLEPITHLQDWVSPRLGVRFDPSAQPLALYRPDGEPLLSYGEMAQRADDADLRAEEEKLRATQEAQRAEEERQRAEEEKLRADRLAAYLISLGLDPDRLP
jgi:Uma2 family endonuclease